MPTTTTLTTADWGGNLAERKAYLKLVKISVNSLGDNYMRVFSGDKAVYSNHSLAWAVHCSAKARAALGPQG